jgi:hypothetical protein
MLLDPCRVRLGHPPFPGDTFVDEGIAVGDEGGHLTFEVADDCRQPSIFLFNRQTYRLLLFSWWEHDMRVLYLGQSEILKENESVNSWY